VLEPDQPRARKLPLAKVREAEAHFLEACAQDPSHGWLAEARLGGKRRHWANQLRRALREGRTLQESTTAALIGFLEQLGINGPASVAAHVLRVDPKLDLATLERLFPHSYYHPEPAAEYMGHPAMTPEKRAEALEGYQGKTMRKNLLKARTPLPDGVLRQVFQSFGYQMRNWWADVAGCPQCPRDLVLEILDNPRFNEWERIASRDHLRNLPEVRERLWKHFSTGVGLEMLRDERPEEFSALVQRISAGYKPSALIARLARHGVPEGATLHLNDIAPHFRTGGTEEVRAALRLPARLLTDLSPEEADGLERHPEMGSLPRVRALTRQNPDARVLLMLLREGPAEDVAEVARCLVERDAAGPLIEWLERNELPAGAHVPATVLAPVFTSTTPGLAERALRVLYRLAPAPPATAVAGAQSTPAPTSYDVQSMRRR
jgi:hypothetical protein